MSYTILIYIFKSTIISFLFIVYYYLFLKDRNIHTFNRFYLLFASFLSLILPCLHLNFIELKSTADLPTNKILYFVSKEHLTNKIFFPSNSNYLIIILSIISLLLLSILSINLIKIFDLKNKSLITKNNDFILIQTDSDSAPFTFFNNLFWNKSISLFDSESQLILKHELIHIRQKHSIDRLYCQIVSSIFWINPINWIIQKEIVLIHEFIADEFAFGEDKSESFAKILLKAHYHDHFFNPVIGIFNSSISRRIKNINSLQLPKFVLIRKIMSIPIIFIAIIIFSIDLRANKSRYVYGQFAISSIKLQNNNIQFHYKKKTTKSSDLAKSKDYSITVNAVNKNITIKKSEIENLELPLFLLDSMPMDKSSLNELKIDDIKKVEIKRSINSKIQYGDNTYPGVIYITTIKSKNYN
jgi:hypothetical protein